MAFNFGAFAAGFAGAAERSILQQTQRRDEEEDYKKKLELQFEYEEKSRAAAATRSAATSRREKEEKMLEIAGALQSLGYSPDVIAQITQRGQTTVDMAMNIGQTALAKSIDPNSIWQITSTAVDPDDANFNSEANANLSSFAINAQEYRGLFGEAPEVKTYATVDEALARAQQEVIQLESQGRGGTQAYALAKSNLDAYQKAFTEQNPVIADTAINRLAEESTNYARLMVYGKDVVIDDNGMVLVSSKADPNLATIRSVQEENLAAYSLWERSQAFRSNSANETILNDMIATRVDVAKTEGREYLRSVKEQDVKNLEGNPSGPDAVNAIKALIEEGKAVMGAVYDLGNGKRYLHLGYPVLNVKNDGTVRTTQGLFF